MLSFKSRAVWLAASVVLLAGLVLWLTAEPSTEAESLPDLPPSSSAADHGAATFFGAGFGGISQNALNSNAVPWRLTAAALILEERRRNPRAKIEQATLRDILQRFGFVFPDHIVNLPASARVQDRNMPLGMTWGEIAPIGGSKVMVANLGCAACHAGVTYAADGAPLKDRVMMGMPNSSLNLEAYTQAVYVALRRHARSPKLMDAVQRLFPDIGWREQASLRFLVLPLARSRLDELEGLGRPTSFPNGSPGNTNGVAALKLALGTPLIGDGPGDKGFVSIPDLGARTWRTALLVDGAYRIPGSPTGKATRKADIDDRHLSSLSAIASFFTVPSMGIHPDDAQDGVKDVRAIMSWLQIYRSQPFPAKLDIVKARQGEAVYRAQCAACHGDYAWKADRPELKNFPNWIGDVGTDRLRAVAFDPVLAKAVAKTRYKGLIEVRAGGGYAAPPLAGLWSSAPYLHNGSVPSLATLLSPDLRPAGFTVGGHALDYSTIGLLLGKDGRYPEGYRPFSKPYWFDTNASGQGNRGHEQGASLSQADKAALIEFLKLL
jgi:hypothetical protein